MHLVIVKCSVSDFLQFQEKTFFCKKKQLNERVMIETLHKLENILAHSLGYIKQLIAAVFCNLLNICCQGLV